MKKSISIRMVHVLAVILFAGTTFVESEHCPSDDNISPCVCDGDPYINDVICRNVTSVENLRKAFEGCLFMEPIPKLVIYNLHSSKLPSHALQDIEVVDLEILDGNIPHIDSFAFDGQPLVSLHLDRIRLEDVPTAALYSPSGELKILSMSGNVLKKLKHNSMIWLYVENLTLSKNEISEVARDSFPISMQYLWISNNKLRKFNGALLHTKDLKYLDASENALTSIKGEFEGLLGLKTVNLDENQITDISDSFSGLSLLRKLSLFHNHIQEIGEAFADLEHLTHLDLGHNGIANLSLTAFKNLKNLYALNLSKNYLTALQICTNLIPVRSLRILNLSDLQLKHLSSDCLDDKTLLEHVYLGHNQLSALWLTNAGKLATLDVRINNFRFMNNLHLPMHGSATLLLSENQWLCSNETTSLLKDLEERGYSFPDGYPRCLPISEKAQTCVKWEDYFPPDSYIKKFG